MLAMMKEVRVFNSSRADVKSCLCSSEPRARFFAVIVPSLNLLRYAIYVAALRYPSGHQDACQGSKEDDA